jgi:hypothetical protein
VHPDAYPFSAILNTDLRDPRPEGPTYHAYTKRQREGNGLGFVVYLRRPNRGKADAGWLTGGGAVAGGEGARKAPGGPRAPTGAPSLA